MVANLHKRFSSFELDVSLSFGTGVTALVGPSGAGKTTILRCLAGLVKPENGRIVFNGSTWLDTASGRDVPVQHRGIGFIFQDIALFPHMDVQTNIKYGATSAARVDELVALLDLKPLHNRLPGQLSAGQQQRVALARALAANPRLLLLDEPFSALDTHLKERLYCELTTLVSRFEVPAVLVTHDLVEATRLARHMIVLSDGKVLQSAAPEEVIWRPSCPEVAQLAGIRNIFQSPFGRHGTLIWGDYRIETNRVAAAGSAQWCIRPEQVKARPQGTQPGNSFGAISACGIVREIHLVGHAKRLIVSVSDAGALEVVLAAGDATEWTLGQVAELWLPPAAIHVFSPDGNQERFLAESPQRTPSISSPE